MKKLLIIAAIATATISCKKENVDDSSNYFMTVEKDDNVWTTTTHYFEYSKPNSKDSITLWGDVGEEHLALKIKNAAGTYTGNAVKGAYSVTLGGDVSLRAYEVINDPNNKVILSEINDKQASGRFNLTLVSTYIYGTPNGYRGDTIRLKNGEFKVKVYQRATL